MKSNLFRRSMSMLLCSVLLLQLVPVVSFAQETSVNEIPWGDSREEVSLLETERSTTYDFKDLKTTDKNGNVIYGLVNHGESREVVSLNDIGWKFSEGSGSTYLTEENASGTGVDDSDWESVTLPHTWNADDTQDGTIGNMNKTLSWYRGQLAMESIDTNKHYYLEFKGANQITKVFVNGNAVPLAIDVADYSANSNILGVDIGNDYAHMGGYTAFRFDLTTYLNQGDNLIAISVDNRITQEIAPINADFNFYGGIYRDLNLVIVDNVHVAMDDYGSSGLYVQTPNGGKQATNVTEQPENLGQLDIRAEIQNDAASDKEVTVSVSVMDESGTTVVTAEGQSMTIPANGSADYSKTVVVDNPTLWEGIDYSENADNKNAGYQYTVVLEVKEGNTVVDTVQEKVGFRWFYVDALTGFYLNGESYPLRGVCRHQDRQGKGNAVSYEDHLEDIQMIMEMGANAVRLSHYPQDSYVYDLCDANGIVVWAEIPLIDFLGTDTSFDETTKSMLVELIRQQYNHPSICFWGSQNELRWEVHTGSEYTVSEIMGQLDTLAKTEDPTRYTTQANNVKVGLTSYWASDLMALNFYPGWYWTPGFEAHFNTYYELEKSNNNRPFGISEYGTGAGINTTIHELNPTFDSVKPNSDWQPEEYQSIQHEEALRFLLGENGKKVWGSFLWNMFDFAVDHRAREAEEVEKNNKGLVSFDRTTRKDAFYLYKANLNDQDPFVYITSRRYESRTETPSYIKVYSNCDQVWLSISKDDGDAQIIEMTKDAELNVFTVEDQMAEIGEYDVKVYGIREGNEDIVYTDSVSWSRAASSSTDLISSDEAVVVSSDYAQITIDKEMTMEQLRTVLTGDNRATYKVYANSEEVTDAAATVRAGMTLVVTAEDGETTKTYYLLPTGLTTFAEVSASSYQTDNLIENAIDGNSSTRWAASGPEMPQHYIIDLQDQYNLTSVSIDWYNKTGTRTYTYNVYVSRDNETWEKAVTDRIATCVDADCMDTVELCQMIGRYVKIEVTACSVVNSHASFYEVQVNGWKLEIDDIPDFSFTVDQVHYQIICNQEITTVSYADFGKALSVKGTAYLRLNSVGPNNLNEGDSVTVTDMDSNEFTYAIVTKGSEENNLTRYKPVYSSSYQNGNFPENAIDGDGTTRWAASGPEMPQHYIIDLLSQYTLNSVSVDWFNRTGKRTYTYNVYVSQDNETWDQVITDRVATCVDTDRVDTVDLGQRKARYVKIEVTACSVTNAYASFFEVQVDGWKFEEKLAASVAGQNYSTVTDAVAAANGEVVTILASTDEEINIDADLTLDLAGNTLSNVTVADGAILTLIDTTTDDFEGEYGSAAVIGTVATFAKVDGKTYLVVSENGVYSAHCYNVALTHISLNPAKDALGYKAKLYGDEIVQSHVQSFGFNLWVDGGQVKTYGKTGTDVLTLRLQNILKCGGGEMNINATAFVTLTANGNSTTKTCGQQTTTMKHTLQLIDEVWSTYTEAQQTAVKALCDQYYETVSAWKLYNIYPELDDTAALAETYETVTGTVFSGTHNGFAVQDGQLVAPSCTGEGKVILTESFEGDKSISVDIYPVSGNLINTGIYLAASNAAAAQDSINALTVIVESTVEDNPNRVDIVIGNFPTWEQYHRTVIEGDSALFTDGVKEALNLTVDISGNELTVTLALLSDPSKAVTVTYTYTGAYDLSAGLVGLRSQYHAAAFDNFKVTNSQQTVKYTFDSDADVAGLEFYHSTWTGGVTATSDQTLALHSTAIFANGTLTAELNTNGSYAAGIVFGADESGESYYLYRLTANRYAELVKVENGKETVLDKGYLGAGHKYTNFNRVQVVKDGSTIYCYYYNKNHDKIICYAVYEDTTPLTGERIGLWAETSGTVFQNVTTSSNMDIRKADVLIFGHSYTEMWPDYETYFPEYPSIDDVGIGGSVAVHWESLADEVIAYEPKLGIYNIGINDLTGGTTPKAVINSIEKALLDIKAALPKFEVVLVSVSHCPARSTLTAQISQTNALMRNLAASYDWIHYAEAEYLFCTDSSDPLSTDASLFIDGLHPSAEGYQLMADMIRSAIKGENQPVFDEVLAQEQFEAAQSNKIASMGIYSQNAYTAENWVNAEVYYNAAVEKINACTTEDELEALDLSTEIAALNAIPNKSVDVIANILNTETQDAWNANSWSKTDDNTVNVNGYSYALDNTATYSDMEVVFKVSNNTGTVGTGGVFLRATQKDNNGIEGYLVNYVSSGNYMQVYYVNNAYNTDGSSYVQTYLGGIAYGSYGDIIGTEFHVKIEGDKLYLSTLERHQAGKDPLTVVDLTYNGAYEVYESGYIGILAWNKDVSYNMQLKNLMGEEVE